MRVELWRTTMRMYSCRRNASTSIHVHVLRLQQLPPRISSPSSLSLHVDSQVMHGAGRLEEAWLPQLQPLQRFGATVLPMLYSAQAKNHDTNTAHS